LKKIDGVRGVISVSRVGADAVKQAGGGSPVTSIRGEDASQGKK
jgi:hypothetical protein